MGSDATGKPEKLYLKTYLQLLRNSVGTEMFRNFYVKNEHGETSDALSDGSNSCAFYVSAVLVIFKKLSAVHGTIQSTCKDLQSSGWQLVEDLEPGDVIVWQKMQFSDGEYEHMGFYLGNNRAVSTSWTKKTVVEHDTRFGDMKRPIEQTWRHNNWDKN